MRSVVAFVCAVGALCASSCAQDEPPWFIRGSARLPDCNEAPAFNLQGTTWFDNGTVTVQTDGCEEPAGATLDVCGLTWVFEQTGADVKILVDNEYEIRGRACGDQLHLEGGWWLTVRDSQGYCDYEDGVEVGIEAGGSTLTVAQDTLTGTLLLAEDCTAEYDVTFFSAG